MLNLFFVSSCLRGKTGFCLPGVTLSLLYANPYNLLLPCFFAVNPIFRKTRPALLEGKFLHSEKISRSICALFFPRNQHAELRWHIWHYICFMNRDGVRNEEEEEGEMAFNFFPNREQMSKEVELCIAIGKLDTLLSICNSCVNKLFDNNSIPECCACKVQQGIIKVSNKKKRQHVEDEELLGVC